MNYNYNVVMVHAKSKTQLTRGLDSKLFNTFFLLIIQVVTLKTSDISAELTLLIALGELILYYIIY